MNPVQREIVLIEIARFDPIWCRQQLAIGRKRPRVVRANDSSMRKAAVEACAQPGAAVCASVIPRTNVTVVCPGHNNALITDRGSEVVARSLQRIHVANTHPFAIPDLLELELIMVRIVVPTRRQRLSDFLQCFLHLKGPAVLSLKTVADRSRLPVFSIEGAAERATSARWAYTRQR